MLETKQIHQGHLLVRTIDCIHKTIKGPGGIFALYNGFGISCVGTMFYSAVVFGTYDMPTYLNPHRNDTGVIGIISKFVIAQHIKTIFREED